MKLLLIVICGLWTGHLFALNQDSLLIAKQQEELTKILSDVEKKLADRQQMWSDAQSKKVEYDTLGLGVYRYEMYLLKQERKALEIDFIRQHPHSRISIKVLNDVIGHLPEDIKSYAKLYEGLDQEVRESKEGKKTKKTIDHFLTVAIGAQAPTFEAPDTIGNPVKLSDYGGKYVLLDFWASWCGPCREENPNLVKAYHEFKDKNFDILSVSLDQQGKRDAWINAIHKDKLTWKQVSDLKYWQSEVAVLYCIRSIPQNFLINPDGKIVAVNLRGEALRLKLRELLK